MRVSDNGRGFGSDRAGAGHGLLGMLFVDSHNYKTAAAELA
jgi:hypothetical protein